MIEQMPKAVAFWEDLDFLYLFSLLRKLRKPAFGVKSTLNSKPRLSNRLDRPATHRSEFLAIHFLLPAFSNEEALFPIIPCGFCQNEPIFSCPRPIPQPTLRIRSHRAIGSLSSVNIQVLPLIALGLKVRYMIRYFL